MVYTLQKLPNEPIIIDTHSEPMDVSGYLSFSEQLADTASRIEGTIYRISDLRQMTFSFPTLIAVLSQETRSKRPGSAGDPRVRMTVVATGKVAGLIEASAEQEQYGELHFPIFETVEDALAYVRARIKTSGG